MLKPSFTSVAVRAVPVFAVVFAGLLVYHFGYHSLPQNRPSGTVSGRAVGFGQHSASGSQSSVVQPLRSLCEPATNPVGRDAYGRRIPLSWASTLLEHDFRHWSISNGVQRADLNELRWNGRYKVGLKSDAFRFQIVNGIVWIDFSVMQPRGMGPIKWFPSSAGPGNMATAGRVPLAMIALAEVARNYKGQLPDVDAVLNLADVPFLPGAPSGHADAFFQKDAGNHPALPPPLLGMCSNADHYDLTFPDWSFWGLPALPLQFGLSQKDSTWEGQRQHLLKASARMPLANRKPALLYRGRATTAGDKWRKEVVQCGSKAPRYIRSLMDTKSVTWLDTQNIVKADVVCSWRYLVYIESAGWSASLKYRLACGSVLLQVAPRLWEWFSRGLVRGTHFLQVPNDPPSALCPSTLATLSALEMKRLHFASGTGYVQGNASAAGLETRHKNSSPADRSMPGHPEDGSRQQQMAAAVAAVAADVTAEARAAIPEDMSAALTDFVDSKLRMQDVREYIVDLLWKLSDVQHFNVTPSKGAKVMTHRSILDAFMFDRDRQEVAAAYPWLRCGLDGSSP